MTTVQASGVAGRFLDALSQRDFEAPAATFTEDGGIAWMNLVCSGHRPLAIE